MTECNIHPHSKLYSFIAGAIVGCLFYFTIGTSITSIVIAVIAVFLVSIAVKLIFQKTPESVVPLKPEQKGYEIDKILHEIIVMSSCLAKQRQRKLSKILENIIQDAKLLIAYFKYDEEIASKWAPTLIGNVQTVYELLFEYRKLLRSEDAAKSILEVEDRMESAFKQTEKLLAELYQKLVDEASAKLEGKATFVADSKKNMRQTLPHL
ncbi:MAG: hypothetical protein NTW50_05070 [Candidatus Berkelbacteria bacterium]|nr:hypothetical protein [Candidatus Berkelbacteria bacterium]